MGIRRLIADKKAYKHYKARKEALPANYRTVVDAVERYLYYFASAKGDDLIPLLNDVADLMEEAAASGTPIAAVVGDDPVEFADGLIRNYPPSSYIQKERERLIHAVESVTDTPPPKSD